MIDVFVRPLGIDQKIPFNFAGGRFLAKTKTCAPISIEAASRLAPSAEFDWSIVRQPMSNRIDTQLTAKAQR